MLPRRAVGKSEGTAGDLRRYPVLGSSKLFAVLAVTDTHSRIVGGIKIDFIADFAAITSPWVNHCNGTIKGIEDESSRFCICLNDRRQDDVTGGPNLRGAAQSCQE